MSADERMKAVYSFIVGLLLGAVCYWHFAPHAVKERTRTRTVIDTLINLVPAVAEKKVMLPAKIVYSTVEVKDTVLLSSKFDKIISAQTNYEDSLIKAGIIYYFDTNEFFFRYGLKEREIPYIKETHYIEKEKKWHERFAIGAGLGINGGAIIGAQYEVYNQIYLGVFYRTF